MVRRNGKLPWLRREIRKGFDSGNRFAGAENVETQIGAGETEKKKRGREWDHEVAGGGDTTSRGNLNTKGEITLQQKNRGD